MNKIVKILMERDGMSRSEAEALVSEVWEEVTSLIASGFFNDAEYVFESGLGLELDYMLYLF